MTRADPSTRDVGSSDAIVPLWRVPVQCGRWTLEIERRLFEREGGPITVVGQAGGEHYGLQVRAATKQDAERAVTGELDAAGVRAIVGEAVPAG